MRYYIISVTYQRFNYLFVLIITDPSFQLKLSFNASPCLEKSTVAQKELRSCLVPGREETEFSHKEVDYSDFFSPLLETCNSVTIMQNWH